MGTDRERPLKTALTETSGSTRCSEDISVQRRQIDEGQDMKVDHNVHARCVEDGAVFLLVWEN